MGTKLDILGNLGLGRFNVSSSCPYLLVQFTRISIVSSVQSDLKTSSGVGSWSKRNWTPVVERSKLKAGMSSYVSSQWLLSSELEPSGSAISTGFTTGGGVTLRIESSDEAVEELSVEGK